MLTAAAAAGGPSADGWESTGLAHVTARAVTCLPLVASLLAGSPHAALPLLVAAHHDAGARRGGARHGCAAPGGRSGSSSTRAGPLSAVAVVAGPATTPPVLPPRLTADVVRGACTRRHTWSGA